METMKLTDVEIEVCEENNVNNYIVIGYFNNNIEGNVLAKINIKGEIIWEKEYEEYKYNNLVSELIDNFFDCHLFSEKDSISRFREKIADEIEHLTKDDCYFIDVMSKDDVCAFAIQKIEIMGVDNIAVGMYGNGQFKVFNIDEVEVAEAITYLLNDIEDAVGTTFVLEF